MKNMTLAIPEDLKEKMDQHPQFNWSEVARIAIRRQIEAYELLDRMRSESSLTEEDAIRFGREVNKKLAKRSRKE